MEYGQAIPNRVLQMSNINGVSKSKFAQIFCQGLVQIGMKFVGQLSTYDVLDPVNAEVGTPQSGSFGEYGQFVFDFPTNEYYTVGTQRYRPCVIVNAARQDYNLGWYGNINFNAFSIRLARRRWDRVNASDLRTWHYYRVNQNNFGIGNPNEGSQQYMPGAGMKYKEGLPYDNADPRWLPFIGATGGNGGPSALYTRNFANLFMYLGTGGLYIAVGSDATKAGFASWMSYMAVFAGGRIPGRALIPNQDTNLARIDPMFELPMHNGVNSAFWDGTQLYANVMGMQFNLKQRPDTIIYTLVTNLENIEEPIYPSFAPNVLRSPRVVNGSGAYVLSRPVLIPKYVFNDANDLMGPVDVQITPSDTRPKWEDLFTAPNFRLGDRTVTPYVEYIDPIDSKHWYIVYAQNTNMAYAFDYTARTIYTAINIGRTVTGTIAIDLSVGGFSGPFPAEVVSVTSTNPSNQPPPWTPTAGQNEALITETGVTYSDKDLVVIVQPNPADAADTVYELQIDLKLAATVAQNPPSNRLQLFIYDLSNNAVQVVYMQADTNPLAPQQTYRTFRANMPTQFANGQLKFLVRYHNDGYNDSFVAGLRNMQINKYEYAAL